TDFLLNLTLWIDLVNARGIQHLDICFDRSYRFGVITPLSLYTCETLVHLRLSWVILVHPEFAFLPCLKIMHLECIKCPNEATLEKLILGSPVLEDVTIIAYLDDAPKVLQVRSQTLKRIHINVYTKVVSDAPLLQYLKTEVNPNNHFKITSSGSFAKVDISFGGEHSELCEGSMTRDILTAISRVRDLVISFVTWE
ncbi:hypothetical protein EUTSA_v10023168mg, partial [Eutrema salsugineum]